MLIALLDIALLAIACSARVAGGAPCRSGGFSDTEGGASRTDPAPGRSSGRQSPGWARYGARAAEKATGETILSRPGRTGWRVPAQDRKLWHMSEVCISTAQNSRESSSGQAVAVPIRTEAES